MGRLGYNTKSNKTRIVKTPGGKLTILNIKKKPKGPICGDCGAIIHGIPHLRPKEYRSISKRQKSVNRSYGGVICGKCVRKRIIRSFLLEEQKIVKRVLKNQAASTKEKKGGKKKRRK